jgi:hypothetical protein
MNMNTKKLEAARHLCHLNDERVMCLKVFTEELEKLDLSQEEFEVLLTEEKQKSLLLEKNYKKLETQVDELSAELLIKKIESQNVN